MIKRHLSRRYLGLMGLAFGMGLCAMPRAHALSLPDPQQDVPLAANGGAAQSITLAGGCFWGVQAVFQHVKGITGAVSGYAGGKADTAQYEMVGGGLTGHAESVQVSYDPAQISLGQILKIYFAVAHNPTEFNYQGPDHGTQYRSAIFYSTPEQRKLAAAYIAQLDGTKLFPAPIVTTLEPLQGFYPAEPYHQDYLRLHPDNPYIVANDIPKLQALAREYPALYIR